LAARLRPALDLVRAVFEAPAFDPAAAKRVVRIAAVDTQSILYGPALMARLARDAPGLELRFVPLGADTPARVEQGDIEFAFALSTTPLPPGAMTEPLASDRLALVMRRAHPRARKRWSAADYGDVDHVGVAIFGDGQSEIDTLLAARGVQRRIAFVSPHFTAALAVVAQTDLVTTLSRAFAQRFAEPLGLVLHEPPFEEVHLHLTLVWSHVRTNDPLNAWLRGAIREAAASAHRDD
jgi:DNA-binding transcriptional LysR family regulator